MTVEIKNTPMPIVPYFRARAARGGRPGYRNRRFGPLSGIPAEIANEPLYKFRDARGGYGYRNRRPGPLSGFSSVPTGSIFVSALVIGGLFVGLPLLIIKMFGGGPEPR